MIYLKRCKKILKESGIIKIVEFNLTKDNLKNIKSIDDTFYIENITNIQWYMERYNNGNKGIALMDNNKMVGYVVAAPIKKELYDAITSGVIINDVYINPKMFVKESDYKYVVSCVLLEQYRSKGYAFQLMKILFDNAKGHYCALTITDKGFNLASKFMELKLTLNSKISVFIKEV